MNRNLLIKFQQQLKELYFSSLFLGVVDSTTGISNIYGKDVETKILALNPGETSEVIKGNDGYYFVLILVSPIVITALSPLLTSLE